MIENEEHYQNSQLKLHHYFLSTAPRSYPFANEGIDEREIYDYRVPTLNGWPLNDLNDSKEIPRTSRGS